MKLGSASKCLLLSYTLCTKTYLSTTTKTTLGKKHAHHSVSKNKYVSLRTIMPTVNLHEKNYVMDYVVQATKSLSR